MKITNLKNHKGAPLKEWILEKEHDDYFILKEPNGTAILNYPKANFENEKEHAGASRQGNKFFIPEKSQVKR